MPRAVRVHSGRAAWLAMLVSLACGPVAPPPDPPKKKIERKHVVVVAPPERELPAVSVHRARSQFSLEVLGLEMVGTVDPNATKAARTLTAWLRLTAKQDGQIRLGIKNQDLIDARLIANCQNDELACMQKIAKAVRAERILYGIVNDLGGDGYYVHVTLLDATTGFEVKWTGTTRGTDKELEYTAKVAFDSLISRAP